MELISYAMDFSSFLIQNFKEKERDCINRIILFGSAARDEADRNSDVDIFIDVMKNAKPLKETIKKMKERFFDSAKFKNYWNLFGIKNEINFIIGNLEEWELKDSMIGSSITLYEKYSPKLTEGENKIILSWGAVKNSSKRVMLSKKLFGYFYYGKKYKGILETYLGYKIGSNVIIIPAEQLSLFLKEFKKFKITVKIKRIFEYSG
jgi:predicted nucleotidyltransferase